MQENNKPVIVYTTCPSLEVAEEIGTALVEQHHAACVNVLPTMVAIYTWNGKPHRDTETAMLVKTRAELSSKVIQTITELHPYDLPAALVLTSSGSKEFEAWILEQTQSSPARRGPE